MSALTYVGTVSLLELCPMAAAASVTLKASVGVILPKLAAQLEGIIAMQASLALTPPTIVASITVATELLAGLQASLSLGLPGIDFQIAAVAALFAKITADIASLGAAVSFSAELDAALAAPGIDVYAYDGRVEDMGTLVSTEFAGGLPGGTLPPGHCNALVLVTESTTTWAGMSTFFKVG